MKDNCSDMRISGSFMIHNKWK